MNNIYILRRSKRKDKKYSVVTPSGKTVHFGAVGYSDYIKNKSDIKRNAYIARHKVNENFNDLNSAGAWSRWILWEKKSLNEAIKNMERKFNIVIK